MVGNFSVQHKVMENIFSFFSLKTIQKREIVVFVVSLQGTESCWTGSACRNGHSLPWPREGWYLFTALFLILPYSAGLNSRLFYILGNDGNYQHVQTLPNSVHFL